MIPDDLLAITTEDPPKRDAVYFLVVADEVVYVGSSGTPARRVYLHRNAGRKFDRVLYLPCRDTSPQCDPIKTEREWIHRLAPKHNRAGNPKPDLTAEQWGPHVAKSPPTLIANGSERLTVAGVAKKMGLSTESVRSYARRGYISFEMAPAYGYGQQRTFDPAEIDAFASGGAPAAKAYRESLEAKPTRKGRMQKV